MDFAYDPGIIDEVAPLIYRWMIEDADGAMVYCYVGKAKRGAHRPLIHYPRNVANCNAGRPYRRGAPHGFREVHRQLAGAVLRGHRITLTLLSNVAADEDINAVEQAMQRRYNCYPHRSRIALVTREPRRLTRSAQVEAGVAEAVPLGLSAQSFRLG